MLLPRVEDIRSASYLMRAASSPKIRSSLVFPLPALAALPVLPPAGDVPLLPVPFTYGPDAPKPLPSDFFLLFFAWRDASELRPFGVRLIN